MGEKIYSVLKNESPFKIHFKSIIETNLKSVHRNDSVDVDKKNVFFSPLFLDIIYDYLHILPLWTGLMPAVWSKRYSNKYEFPSRFTNNPVEEHFNITKNSVMNKEKKILPSTMASLFYARIQCKYIQYYAGRETIAFECSKPIMFFENLKDKTLKTKKKKNDRVSYYSNFHDDLKEPLVKLDLRHPSVTSNIEKYIGK